MSAFQDVRRRSTGKFRTRRGQETKNMSAPLTFRSAVCGHVPGDSTAISVWRPRRGYFFFSSPIRVFHTPTMRYNVIIIIILSSILIYYIMRHLACYYRCSAPVVNYATFLISRFVTKKPSTLLHVVATEPNS